MGGALETTRRQLFDALDKKDADAVIRAAAKDEERRLSGRARRCQEER